MPVALEAGAELVHACGLIAFFGFEEVHRFMDVVAQCRIMQIEEHQRATRTPGWHPTRYVWMESDVVWFLASDASRAITGQEILADRGWAHS